MDLEYIADGGVYRGVSDTMWIDILSDEEVSHICLAIMDQTHIVVAHFGGHRQKMERDGNRNCWRGEDCGGGAM